MERLVVVADNSLIVEAIAIGLRKSGEFSVCAHVDARTATAQMVGEWTPEVVLVDDMHQSPQILNLIRQLRAEQDGVAVIVLTLAMDPTWLDAIFDAGATGAISKVIHPLALTTLVRETINGHVLHVYKPRSPRRTHAQGVGVGVEGLSLTPRELEVLQLVARGCSNAQIAQTLWVTKQTVKFHLSNVYRKLDVDNRTEASHYAHLNGLVSAPGLAAT